MTKLDDYAVFANKAWIQYLFNISSYSGYNVFLDDMADEGQTSEQNSR